MSLFMSLSHTSGRIELLLIFLISMYYSYSHCGHDCFVQCILLLISFVVDRVVIYSRIMNYDDCLTYVCCLLPCHEITICYCIIFIQFGALFVRPFVKVV